MTCFSVLTCLLPKCCISECCKPEPTTAAKPVDDKTKTIAVQAKISTPTQQEPPRSASPSERGPVRVAEIQPRPHPREEAIRNAEDPKRRRRTPITMDPAQQARMASIRSQINAHHKQASEVVSIGTALKEGDEFAS